MATEINIDPEFEDENEFRKRLEDQMKGDQSGNAPNEYITSGEPEIENDLPGSPNAVPFQNAKPGDKSSEQQAKDIEQKERKRYRREQQERLADFQRQQTEQRRQQQQAKKDEIAASREIVRDIRSQAISQRVEAYSLSAAIGLPGYITASVADSLFIRPNEDKRVRQEQQYQAELARYYEQVRKDAEAKAAAERAAIKNAPMNATVFDAQGRPIPPGTVPTPVVQAPTQPPPAPVRPAPTYDKNGIRFLNSPPVSSGQPPQPPVQPPTPPTPPVPPTPGGPPTPPRPPVPPPIPPVPPPRPPTGAPSAISPAIIVTAALEVARLANSKVTEGIQEAGTLGQNIIKDDYIGATKQVAKGIGTTLDPLGLNLPVTVAVQGFNALLDINQAILEATQENIGFAPQSLEASVQSDISKLVQQISISQRTDATTAELIRANRQLEEAWMEIKAKLINEYGPAIVAILKVIAQAVGPVASVISNPATVAAAFGPIIGPYVFTVIKALNAIAANTEKEEIDQLDNNIFKQMDQFFNPKTPVRVR